MKQLRDPVTGCAWDVSQDSASIAHYVVEEAYEVVDAVERADMDDLRDELGDVLLQVVFHSQIAEEAGAFKFDDVVAAIVAKLIRRHPHVFHPDGTPLAGDAERLDKAEIAVLWSAIKTDERRRKSHLTNEPGRRSPDPLGDVARSLPALSRAEKLSKRAAIYGFDWPNPVQVVAKVREELDEVVDAMANRTHLAVAEEVGDLLFAVANLARHLGIDPEHSLHEGNRKFERRFGAMADLLDRTGMALEAADLETMESAWQAVKDADKTIE